MPENPKSKAVLKARAEELRFMGNQYALNGLPPPPQLQAEYDEIQSQLGLGKQDGLAQPGIDGPTDET